MNRDWGGFRAIIDEANALAEENRERERNPVDCPKCGALLQVNSRGERDCPMGHWRFV